LSNAEANKLSKTVVQYSLVPHRYDVLNFFYQMKYIFTGKWSGPVGDQSRKYIYCSELGAIAMDETRNCFDGKTWDKNPLDIELSECLKVKNI
jgi:hypothetical protein